LTIQILTALNDAELESCGRPRPFVAGTEAGTHFGKPTVKVNGRALISPSRESGSFVLHAEAATKLLLLETDPDTYWQTPHYEGWPSLLIRYNSPDPERVLAMVEQAYKLAMASKPARKRKGKGC